MRKLAYVLIAWASMTTTGTSADGSISVTESLCAKLPMPCSILCQESRAEESRAAALEATAYYARLRADKAEKIAVYYEKLAEEKSFEAQRPYNEKSRVMKPPSELLWKATDTLLRQFVPPHARNSSRSKNNPTQRSTPQYQTRRSNSSDRDITKAMRQADEEWVVADEAEKAADKAKRDADAARASANIARRSYKECVCR